jgi:hypothetical protein
MEGDAGAKCRSVIAINTVQAADDFKQVRLFVAS